MRNYKFIFFLLLPFFTFGESKWKLSSNATISLLTCKEGDQIYSSFGHSGIRVIDSLNKIDLVYNYGAFNYSVATFYKKFLQGDLTFYLVIIPTEHFLEEYQEENRTVLETPLKLDTTAKQQLFDYLMWNAAEENAAYSYHFIYDNCATRIISLFETKLDTNFSFHFNKEVGEKSYRDWSNTKLQNHNWVALFLYFAMGVETDKKTTEKESCYLPSNLLLAFQKATIQGEKIADNEIVLLQGKQTKTGTKDNSAFIFVTLLFSLTVLSLFSSSTFCHQTVSSCLLFVVGMVGAFLWALSFESSFTAMQKNYNLLWAIPLSLFVPFFLFKKKKWDIQYLRYYGIYLIVLVPVFYFLPQQIYSGLYVWCGLLGFYFLAVSKKLTELN